jgi:hypothetical protein
MNRVLVGCLVGLVILLAVQTSSTKPSAGAGRATRPKASGGMRPVARDERQGGRTPAMTKAVVE